MDKYTPRHGSGFPAWEHTIFMQDAFQRSLRDAFADYIAISDSFVVDGCLLTETPVGSATQYAMTAGTVCLRGEFLPVAAQSATVPASQVVYFIIDDQPIDPFPDVNIDGQVDYVMRQRTAKMQQGVAYPASSVSLAIPRKSDLDMLRLKGRVVPKGGILPYFGSMSGFDATGLGITGTSVEGFAVCNGMNGTVDLRGMVPMGATNVPSSGAGALFAGVAGPSDAGDALGADETQLAANNLPAHTHPYVDEIVSYSESGPVGGQGGGGRPLVSRVTSPNVTTNDPFSVRQSSRALVFIQSIV